MENQLYRATGDETQAPDAVPATPAQRFSRFSQALNRMPPAPGAGSSFKIMRAMGLNQRLEKVRGTFADQLSGEPRGIAQQSDQLAQFRAVAQHEQRGPLNENEDDFSDRHYSDMTAFFPAAAKDYDEERQKLLEMAFPEMPKRELATLKTIDKTQGAAGIGYALANLLSGSGGEALLGLAAPVQEAQSRLDEEYENRLLNIQQSAEQARYMLGVLDGREAFEQNKYLAARQQWVDIAMQGRALSFEQVQFASRMKLETLLANNTIDQDQFNRVLQGVSIPDHFTRQKVMSNLSKDDTLPPEIRAMAEAVALAPPTAADRILSFQMEIEEDSAAMSEVQRYIAQESRADVLKQIRAEAEAAYQQGRILKKDYEWYDKEAEARIRQIDATVRDIDSNIRYRTDSLKLQWEQFRENVRQFDEAMRFEEEYNASGEAGVAAAAISDAFNAEEIGDMFRSALGNERLSGEEVEEVVLSSDLAPSSIAQMGNMAIDYEERIFRRMALLNKFSDELSLRVNNHILGKTGEEGEKLDPEGRISIAMIKDLLGAAVQGMGGEERAEYLQEMDFIMRSIGMTKSDETVATANPASTISVSSLTSDTIQGLKKLFSGRLSNMRIAKNAIRKNALAAGVEYSPTQGFSVSEDIAVASPGQGGEASPADPFSGTSSGFSIRPELLKTTFENWDRAVYGWGDASRDSADCSGFICSSLTEMGYSQGRTTSGQLRAKRSHVPKDQVKKGDLVFWHNKNRNDSNPQGVGHVGYFLGWEGNNMIVMDSSGSRGVERRKIRFREGYHSFGRPWKDS